MHSKTTLVILLLCCALSFPLAYAFAESTAEQAVGQGGAAAWDHLALPHDSAGLDGNLSRQINRLGKENWQLVCVTPISEDGTTVKTVYYFKRQK